jgi:tRNA pseudouridine55 synthase
VPVRPAPFKVESVNGLLIVDKPAGMTSHDVIKQLRRATGESSMGHLGTLDPMATGVLPVLTGKYTRLAQFFGPLVKSYTGTIRFGFATDTYDAEGKPCSALRDVSLTRAEIEAGARRFLGEMEQTPPPFSAKKVNGSPAYLAARRGEPVALKAVPVLIEEFSIGRIEGNEADFMMRISAGGYVRSVAHDLGAQLGCGAHLARLRRVEAGPFTLEQASALEELCARAAAGTLEETLPHPRTLLPELPAATADPWSAGRMKNGNPVNLPEFSRAPLIKVFVGQRELLAIARRIAGTLFQPLTVIG